MLVGGGFIAMLAVRVPRRAAAVSPPRADVRPAPALLHLHAVGTVHRDLLPADVDVLTLAGVPAGCSMFAVVSTEHHVELGLQTSRHGVQRGDVVMRPSTETAYSTVWVAHWRPFTRAGRWLLGQC